MTEEQQLAAQEKAPASGPDSPEAERVLVIFPHPDDAEFSCGGTMARWAAEGKQITLCIVTNGDRGSDDPEMTPYIRFCTANEIAPGEATFGPRY